MQPSEKKYASCCSPAKMSIIAVSKRAAPSSSIPSTGGSVAAPRPAKRARRASPSKPVASTSALPPAAPAAAPTKRVRQEGSLRRLAVPKAVNHAVREKSTLSGAKVAGKAKDLKRSRPVAAGAEGQDGLGLVKGDVEEIWVGRKQGGMNFGGWLKQGVAAFVVRGSVNTLQCSEGSADGLGRVMTG